MNQPYLQYPSNTAGNADTLMESLGFFWNNIFHERGTLQGLTFAQAEQVVQQYYALESAVNSLAADTLPVLNRIRRFPLIIKRSAVTHVSPVFGDGSSWGAQPTGSNPLFEQVTFKFGGEKVNNLGLQLFAWKPPVVLQSFALLADQLVRPSKVLINNVDAKIAHGSLLFKVHPFTLPNVRPAWLFNENGSPAMFADANNRVTQDSVIVLWAFEAKIDEQAAATAYGWLFDVVQPSSATYSGVLRGLLKLYGNGGSVNHIKSAVAAFLGVKPVVYDGEVVEQIFQYTPTLELALSQTPPPPPPPTLSPCIAGWTLVNFMGTTFRNGDPIPEVTDQSVWNSTTGPAWCYYNNNPANGAIYGKLYNRAAVTDVRGLAPAGHHVPSLAEWETMITCLGGSDAGDGFWPVAGEKMKTTGTSLWNSPNVATNESGFSVVPAGCRTSGFVNLSLRGSFWAGGSSQSGVWTEQESGTRWWQGIASSSDGTKLAAVVHGGRIHTSDDSGVNWEARENIRAWWSITSSSTGEYLAAVVHDGRIHTSDDYGVNWEARESNRAWRSITSSADGEKLAAAVSGGLIYTSVDRGVTWVEQTSAGNRDWYSIASSSTGQYLAAVVELGGLIYTSDDYGVNWVERASGIRDWTPIASSSDGTKLVAAEYNGAIYTSVDRGVTWVERASGIRNWSSITSSADGEKLAAVGDDVEGAIYTSIDSGVTWVEQTSAGNRNWYSIASSSDGTKLAAVVNGGSIYTLSPSNSSDTVINFNHAASYVYIGPDAPTVGYSIRLKQDQVPPTPPTPPTPPGFNQASIRVVQTDRNIYTADSYFQTLPSVIVGAKLASGDVLFDVVEYYDVIEDPTWWLTRVVPKVNQVHTVGSTAVTRKMGFSPSLFAGSCDGELTFKNDVELFTQDAAGNLHFPVEGSRVDVASFNAQLNLNKVAIATAVGLTPGGSVVINPLDFLFNNFLKTGTALIKVNFKSIKQAELFTATFRHIKDALPRNVLFIFFLDFNLPIDSYETLNSSTPILLNGSPVMANADGTNSSGMLVPTATPNYRTNVKTRLFGLSKGVTDTQLLVAINSGSLGSNDLLIKDGSMLTNIPTGKTTKEVNNLLLMNFN